MLIRSLFRGMSSVVCGHEPMLVHTISLLTLALLGLAKAGQDKGMNRQLTLFGEVVPLENDKNAETVWLRVKDAVKDVGDKFSFTMQRAVYNVEKHVLSILMVRAMAFRFGFNTTPTAYGKMSSLTV